MLYGSKGVYLYTTTIYEQLRVVALSYFHPLSLFVKSYIQEMITTINTLYIISSFVKSF